MKAAYFTLYELIFIILFLFIALKFVVFSFTSIKIFPSSNFHIKPCLSLVTQNVSSPSKHNYHLVACIYSFSNQSTIISGFTALHISYHQTFNWINIDS